GGAQGVFVASPTRSGFNVMKVAATGDPSPSGEAFRSFGVPSINGLGEVAFTAGSDTNVIYLAAPNSTGGFDVRLVDHGQLFVCDISQLSLNDSHQAAFLGGNSSGGCGAPNYVIGLSSPNGTQGGAYYSNPRFILDFGLPSLNDAG